jgi:hypothetical protein
MASKKRFPSKFLKRLQQVKSKRPRTVIEHILKNGYITTDQLKTLYGYDHPPRAARDVREAGIPLETFKVVSPTTGRSVAAYRFGDPKNIRLDLGGRRAFSKAFKAALINEYGERCSICSARCEARYLQIDHRVPYEVAGEKSGEPNVKDHMPLCGACNRAKSWSCEHCQNWLEIRDPKICFECYWARPEAYRHVAMRDVRRLDVEWAGEEVADYDNLKKKSGDSNAVMPDFVKSILKKLMSH